MNRRVASLCRRMSTVPASSRPPNLGEMGNFRCANGSNIFTKVCPDTLLVQQPVYAFNQHQCIALNIIDYVQLSSVVRVCIFPTAAIRNDLPARNRLRLRTSKDTCGDAGGAEETRRCIDALLILLLQQLPGTVLLYNEE